MNYQHNSKLMYQDYSKKNPDIYDRNQSIGQPYSQESEQYYNDDYQNHQGYHNMQPQYSQGGYDHSPYPEYQDNYMQSQEPSLYNNNNGSMQPSLGTKDSSLVNQGEIDSRYKPHQLHPKNNRDPYRGTTENLQTVQSELEKEPSTIYNQNEAYGAYDPNNKTFDLHSQLRNNQVYDQNEPFNEAEFQAEMDQEPDQIYQYKNREAFFHTILKDKFLSRALEGINFAILAEDEFAILLIWTAPLRTRLSDETVASKRARSILGVDTIQAQGLIRKTETQLDNLISIVESFHNYNKSLPEDKYMLLLRNCTYSLEKAMELAHNLKELSDIWFSFKRELQIKSGANVGNQALNKPIMALKQNLKNSPGKETVLQKTSMENTTQPTQTSQQTQFGLYNLEILLRMLPYWDVPLNTDTDDSATVRKLFNISRSESQEMMKRLEVGTIGQLIDKHAAKLINQHHKEVEILLTPCFFGKLDKTKDFVKALARIAWEKVSAHPSFFKLFRAFTNLKKLHLHPSSEFKAMLQSLPFNLIYTDLPCEIFIAGGEFPITKEQVNPLATGWS